MSETVTPQRANGARRWLYLAPLAFFAALSVLFLFRLFAGDASRVPSALIGRPAPELTLAPLDGLQINGRPVPGITPADLRDGSVTILNVFASWCVPCRVEHPFLVEMAGTAAVREGRIRIAGLNYKDEPDNGRNAIEWGVYGVPETFLIGRDGTVLTKHIGQLDQASARALMQRALAAVGSRG
jgi:cytochrome c biogenesis protein CcmG, thiol:disulfide interchange protein DsbE